VKKQRLFYLDLIRAVALVCILVIHFNAAVTGYFTLPSKLFGSVLPFNIYLGDFGSSLFFMVSGAALQYTSPGQGREPLNLARFYQKRAKAVYPMFWLAWCIFFPIRFVTKPGYYAAAKTPSLLLTGTLLHDMAKAQEFVFSQLGLATDYSIKGQLLGHLVMGAQDAAETAARLGVPEEKSVLLQHLILSHHGEPEFGAAVRPLCAEAELLSLIDAVDSRMEIYRETYDTMEPDTFSPRIFALEKKVFRHA